MECHPCPSYKRQLVKCNDLDETDCLPVGVSTSCRCRGDNATDERHVMRNFQRAQQHQNGTGTFFKEFWSKTEESISRGMWAGCSSPWKEITGAWKCACCYDGMNMEVHILGRAGGIGKTLHYDLQRDNETWPSPFPNHSWDFKGHYWLWGQQEN